MPFDSTVGEQLKRCHKRLCFMPQAVFPIRIGSTLDRKFCFVWIFHNVLYKPIIKFAKMLSDQMNFLSDQMDFRQTGLTFIGKTDFAKCDVRTSHHNVTYVHVCHICQDMTYVLCHILSTVTPVRHTKTLTSVRHICQNVMDVLYI